MSNVIPLGPRRKLRQAPTGCSCEPGYICYPHRCEAIGSRLERLMRETQGELLVDRELMSSHLFAALFELDAIVAECFRPNGTPPQTKSGGRR